jgi:hypothetical protein
LYRSYRLQIHDCDQGLSNAYPTLPATQDRMYGSVVRDGYVGHPPAAAAATILTSGVAKMTTLGPINGATNMYTTWLRRVILVPDGILSVRNRMVREQRPSTELGMDSQYLFTDNLTGSRALIDLSPNHKYTVTGLADNAFLNIDRYGLYNFDMPVNSGSNPVWVNPINYGLNTGYAVEGLNNKIRVSHQTILWLWHLRRDGN